MQVWRSEVDAWILPPHPWAARIDSYSWVPLCRTQVLGGRIIHAGLFDKCISQAGRQAGRARACVRACPWPSRCWVKAPLGVVHLSSCSFWHSCARRGAVAACAPGRFPGQWVPYNCIPSKGMFYICIIGSVYLGIEVGFSLLTMLSLSTEANMICCGLGDECNNP